MLSSYHSFSLLTFTHIIQNTFIGKILEKDIVDISLKYQEPLFN